MRVIHSMWSKPTFKFQNLNMTDRGKGGWLDKKYNYMSWALSCLQFKKFYSQVELYTDKAGYELLINKLKLPYSNVQVVLDDLNNYHTDLWALGKIYTYGKQNEPFIHADGDVYIWERFPDNLEKAELVAQNIERHYKYYDDVLLQLEQNFHYIPKAINESKKKNQGIIGVNAGLLGGNSLDFFLDYSKQAFEFVDKNIGSLDKVDIGAFNAIFEQCLFYGLAEQQGKNIQCYLQNINATFNGLSQFTDVPTKRKYIHPIGNNKKHKYFCDLLALKLLTEYPDYYFRIIDLLRNHQI